MILITGGSGRIAGRTAALLHAQGLPLRLMSRTPERCPALPGAERVFGDFTDEASLRAAVRGVSVALVVSGMAAPGERARNHRRAFRAAAEAGVEHIVYLSLRGASPSSVFPYCQDHFQSEEYLAEVEVPFTSLRIGFYMDMFFDQVDRAGVLRGPAGGPRGAFLSREDAAQAAAEAVIRKPGGRPEISGPELLGFADVARELSLAIGRRIRYEDESEEDLLRRLERAGLPAPVQEMAVTWRRAVAAGEQAPATGGFRKLAGRGPLTLREYLAAFPALTSGLASDAEPVRSAVS